MTKLFRAAAGLLLCVALSLRRPARAAETITIGLVGSASAQSTGRSISASRRAFTPRTISSST